MLAVVRFRWTDRVLAPVLLHGYTCWGLVEPLLSFRHLSWLPLSVRCVLIALYGYGIRPRGDTVAVLVARYVDGRRFVGAHRVGRGRARGVHRAPRDGWAAEFAGLAGVHVAMPVRPGWRVAAVGL